MGSRKKQGARNSYEPSSCPSPRSVVNVRDQKQPRTAVDPESYMRTTPAWRFGSIRMIEPFGWGQISREEMQKVLDYLKSLETMTWSEILVRHKWRNHHVGVHRLVNEAQECLQEDWQGGVDKVLSLGLNNVNRMWGVIDQGILYVLWWDPAHAICPSTYMDRRS
jgi:hypothetical protein